MDALRMGSVEGLAVVAVVLTATFGGGFVGLVVQSLFGESSSAPATSACRDTIQIVAVSPTEPTPLCGPGLRSRILNPSEPPWQGVWVECTCR